MMWTFDSMMDDTASGLCSRPKPKASLWASSGIELLPKIDIHPFRVVFKNPESNEITKSFPTRTADRAIGGAPPI